MKCELCHKQDASTVLLKRDSAGKQQELYVCKACAEMEQVFGESRGINVATLGDPADAEARPIDNALGNNGSPATPNAQPSIDEMVNHLLSQADCSLEEVFGARKGAECCPKCGMDLTEIAESGSAGCPECYAALKARSSMLSNVLGEYTGEKRDDSALGQQVANLVAQAQAAKQAEDYAKLGPLTKQLRALGYDIDGALLQ